MTRPGDEGQEEAHAARRLPDERGGELRDHGAGRGGGILARVGGLGDGAHEARADDHAVGARRPRRRPPARGSEMPNPSATGTVGVRLHAREHAARPASTPARSPVVPVTDDRVDESAGAARRSRPAASSGVVGATSGTSAMPAASQAASTGAASSSGRSGTIRPLMPALGELAAKRSTPRARSGSRNT